MNQWAERTLELINNENYLDRLQEIYAHEEGERNITQTTVEAIKQSFANGDATALLEQLLDLERFLYKDSYVAFLRKDRTAMERNPATLQRISII